MKVDMKLSNMYGTVTAYERAGKHFIGLGCVWGYDEQEISKELFDAIVKEFGPDEA